MTHGCLCECGHTSIIDYSFIPPPDYSTMENLSYSDPYCLIYPNIIKSIAVSTFGCNTRPNSDGASLRLVIFPKPQQKRPSLDHFSDS